MQTPCVRGRASGEIVRPVAACRRKTEPAHVAADIASPYNRFKGCKCLFDLKMKSFLRPFQALATVIAHRGAGLVPALLVGLVATGAATSAGADSLGSSSSTVVQGPTTTMP